MRLYDVVVIGTDEKITDDQRRLQWLSVSVEFERPYITCYTFYNIVCYRRMRYLRYTRYI